MQEPMIPSLHVPTAHHQQRRRSLPRIPDFQQNSTASEDYGGEIFCYDNIKSKHLVVGFLKNYPLYSTLLFT